jgi:hypothetical protein
VVLAENIRWGNLRRLDVKALVDKVNRHDLWLEAEGIGVTIFRHRLRACPKHSSMGRFSTPTTSPLISKALRSRRSPNWNNGKDCKSMTATARKIAMLPQTVEDPRGESVVAFTLRAKPSPRPLLQRLSSIGEKVLPPLIMTAVLLIVWQWHSALRFNPAVSITGSDGCQ